MTTREDARREAAGARRDGLRLDGGEDAGIRRGAPGGRAPGSPEPGGRPDRSSAGAGLTLAERLYAARERKGVDLYRAERDTKIRARYLAALERGEYGELGGDVYIKGFLRNYAMYLGLDPEEVVAQWRRERGNVSAPKQTLAVPRPIAQPRSGLNFSPGVVVAALLTVLIVAIGAWLGVQVMRFAKPPTLAVTSPREATVTLDSDTTSYTLQGTSIPGATINVELAGGTVNATADSTGAWTLPVDLRRGRNEFQIDAVDPDTGKHAEAPLQVIIMVPFQQIEAPALTLDEPADGTTFENGAIRVSGTAQNATRVSVTATWEGPADGAPAPSAAPSASPAGPSASPAHPSPSANPSAAPAGPTPAPGGPTPPPAITVPVADDGSWNTGDSPLQLTTGRWAVTATASNGDGKSNASLTRHVVVAYKGLNLVVTIKGGNAWVKVWVDGQIDPTVGRAGKTYHDGQVLTFTGQSSVEVRTGSSGTTQFTLNGQSLGALGKRGIPETWLFKPGSPPAQTQRS
jgi:cytoskeletal protein RodZ